MNLELCKNSIWTQDSISVGPETPDSRSTSTLVRYCKNFFRAHGRLIKGDKWIFLEHMVDR